MVETLKFCNYHLYADDTQLYYSFDPSNLALASHHINGDLSTLCKLSEDHSLKINPKKTVALMFANKNVRQDLQNNINVTIEDTIIPFQSSARNLGLILDSNMRFQCHVNHMLKRAYAALKGLYSSRHMLNYATKVMLCESLVLSHFNFCDVVYGPCIDSVSTRRIQKVQNSCLRFIFGIRRRQRISHKLKEVGWLDMYNRRNMHSACFFYKVVKYKTPPYLYQRIVYRTDVHNLNIRRRNIFTIPQHRKQLFKRSFSYNIAHCLNKLNVTDFSQSCHSFRTNLRDTFDSMQ